MTDTLAQRIIARVYPIRISNKDDAKLVKVIVEECSAAESRERALREALGRIHALCWPDVTTEASLDHSHVDADHARAHAIADAALAATGAPHE